MNVSNKIPTAPLELADPMVNTNNADQRELALLLEGARKRLVETGTRNRLIHVNRSSQRANVLNIINERSDEVFDILRVNRRKMKFLATKKDEDEKSQDEEINLAVDVAAEEFDEARYSDQFLETPLTNDKLQKRVLKLSRDARTAEEEQGVNILYLALGFLTWFEDRNSSVAREAPLILLPVELVRNERTSTYDIKCREDDIVTNLPLQERLKSDFGINLPEIDEGEDWSPSCYFERVVEAVSGQDRWMVNHDAIQLGFFSFSKLLMLRDLDPANWIDGRLVENGLIKGLLRDGFEAEDPLFSSTARLDDHLEPSEIFHVVDADASQTKVIEEVRSGRNLVVQGPPGTGKSQTITNILAAAVRDGKSVLFVAEKMAALSVVHNRMVKTGLKDTCLELHSRSANKKAFLQELAQTLANGRTVANAVDRASDLKALRDDLNVFSDTLHTRLEGRDYSPFQAMSEISNLIGREVSPPRVQLESLDELSNSKRDELREKIGELCEALQPVGDKDTHPFVGTKNLSLQPTDLQRLRSEVQTAVELLRGFMSELSRLETETTCSNILSIDDAKALMAVVERIQNAPDRTDNFLETLYEIQGETRFESSIAAASDWQDTKLALTEKFSDTAWEYPIDALRPHLVKGAGSLFSRLFGKYRSASNELGSVLNIALPSKPQQRLALLDQLTAAQKTRKYFKEDEAYLETKLGVEWRGERTDFSAMKTVSEWLSSFNTEQAVTLEHLKSSRKALAAGSVVPQEFTSKIEEIFGALLLPINRLELEFGGNGGLESVPLSTIAERFERIFSELDRYSEWVTLRRCETTLEEAGLTPLVKLLEEGKLSTDQADNEFCYAVSEARWNYARSSVPTLDTLSNEDRHDLVASFRSLDRSRIDEAQTLIREKHLSQLPQGAVGEMGFIRGEIAKKRKHRSIRKVMEAAGGMVQRIKPVFLMSPISVAQYLPPGEVEFDILVIDEASQVRPEEALGAVARARQIVVVGDQKQLPPTSFFDRLVDDADDTEEQESDTVTAASVKAVEMESILSLCEARGLKQSMLEWHYRSRDPSLIMVSNKEFYDGNLILPPSPTQIDDQFGLTLTKVPGVYSSASTGNGRAGTNRIEAEAVVKAVQEHARTRPEFSLGVVTFSKSQADMMTEVLEVARRNDKILDAFLREGKSEDVFVKNIENVQGDERDVILISVGYGPYEANGRLASMRFGPINSDGGERRLNVLFSRSRVRCEVFTSFDPADIDLTRTKANGPRILKRFLDYAKTGELLEKAPTGLGPDSGLEADVAREIRALGYEVDHQVGTAGFRIDLGVRDPEKPGRYILAVECDGATYHSALWARERDRLRQDVLEGFGWEFHRIWSTDWFHRRDQEIQRLMVALESAKRLAAQGLTIEGSNVGYREQTEQLETECSEPGQDRIVLEEVKLTVPAYKKADLNITTTIEPHEVDTSQMADLAAAVVEVEGPVHTVEVARRIATGFGKSRTGSRIQDAVRKALHTARRKQLIQSDKDFWFTEQQLASVPIRDRSEECGQTLKSECLSDMEIRAAANLIERENGVMTQEELSRSIAKLMGFQRVGPDFKKRFAQVLAQR